MEHRLASAIWLLCAVVATAAQPVTSRAVPDDLSDYLEALREEHDLPAIAAIVFRTDAVLAQGAVGLRSRDSDERVTLDDKFHLGSCTKAMTAALIAKLVEDGRLKWTDTVGEAFADQRDKVLPEYHAVTIEQLLTHRSGLPEDRAAGPLLLKLRSLAGSPAQQRRQAIPHVLSVQPAAKPGEKMIYSNAGYLVAAAMAEHATQRNWEELMADFVFKPLGITTGGFGPPGSDEQVDQPRGHGGVFGSARGIRPGSPMADNPIALFPGGAAHMSLPDWVRLGTDHLAAGRSGRGMLKSASYERLHSPPRGETYAMGWGIGSHPRLGQTLSHAGSNTMWFAVIRLAPERDLGVVIATNSASRGSMDGISRAADELLLRYAPRLTSQPTASQPRN